MTDRVRTIEYDPGLGWIARSPFTGEEIVKDFVWRTRDVARTETQKAPAPAGARAGAELKREKKA